MHTYIFPFIHSLASAWFRPGRQLYGSTVSHPLQWATPKFGWLQVQMGAGRYLQGDARERGEKRSLQKRQTFSVSFV